MHTASYLTTVLPAILVFALGLSFTVAPLTATVLAAAPERQVGVASAVNNDIARTAGLFAVAVLPAIAGITQQTYADPAQLSDGFQRAVLIAAALCALGGVLAALTIRDDVLAVGEPTEEVACAACQPSAAIPAQQAH